MKLWYTDRLSENIDHMSCTKCVKPKLTQLL